MPPYERQAEPSKGNFLSWDAGESKDLTILSENGEQSYLHWTGKESVPCTGEGCSLCAEGHRHTVRWTVVARCEDQELPWEMSNTTFFGVEDVAEMAGHLKDLRLRVTRYGTGRQTRYSVLPLTGEEETTKTSDEMELLAAKIRGLCALGNMDPKQELKLFLTEVEPQWANADMVTQMQEFYRYIDAETKGLQPPNEPPPDEPQDIGRYF